MYGYERVGIIMHEYLLAPSKVWTLAQPPHMFISQPFEELPGWNLELKLFYIYYKCIFGWCYLRWGSRSPAGPKGPFQSSTRVRKRMAVGHPNFLVAKKEENIYFYHIYLCWYASYRYGTYLKLNLSSLAFKWGVNQIHRVWANSHLFHVWYC